MMMMMMMMMMMIVDGVVKWFWKVPWSRKMASPISFVAHEKRVRATKEIAVRRLHADNSYDDDNLAVVQVKIIN